MGTTNNTGVYQLPNGQWAYRFTWRENGKKKNRKGTKDEFGNPLKTKKQAVAARKAALEKEQAPGKPIEKKTVEELYKVYCEHGRSGKAYATIKKQDSLWKNHLQKRFGSRFLDEISVAEINDYLSDLYYMEGRAYKYVESFLKMFYLIFGQAYSRNYLDVDTYNKLCINKDTKIHMPKMKVDEDTDIVSFSKEEIQRLDEYFIGTNAETAYMLGRYCGLRINECYGLKWENVNIEMGTIIIDRQMQYQEGLIKLVSLKTRNARRTLYMSPALKAHFTELKEQRETAQTELAAQREQNQIFIIDIDGKKISSSELVNSLPNGKIQTINSMKYHSRTIKEQLQIEFKYHYLRHTYGTRLAEMNTPSHILRNQMGHANINVTQRYYIAVSQIGIDLLMNNLTRI
jgi:hypothetical protein